MKIWNSEKASRSCEAVALKIEEVYFGADKVWVY
jgi:hypothetical protein